MLQSVTQNTSTTATRLYPAVGIAVTVALFAGLAASPASVYLPLIKEGGPIESASALIYFLTAALLVRVAKTQWPFLIILVLFGLRELDMDKAAFTEGLLKSRQYVGDTVAMPERVLSAVLLISIVIVTVIVIRRSVRALRTSGLNGVTLCGVVAFFFGGTAKTLDGIGRKLAPYGVEVPAATEQFATLYEEVAELGMALCLMLAAIAFLRTVPTQGGGRP